jgi:hypothetical protein
VVAVVDLHMDLLVLVEAVELVVVETAAVEIQVELETLEQPILVAVVVEHQLIQLVDKVDLE